MTTNLLSPIHIDKLGHPIDEIRSRALQSVWSKYNLDLVDYCNTENSKLLLIKLMDWFNFKTHPHEEKVLKLILKLLNQPNALSIIDKTNFKKFPMKLEEIKNCIDSNFFFLIQDIKDCIKKLDENLEGFNSEIQISVTNSTENCDGDIQNEDFSKSGSQKFIDVDVSNSRNIICSELDIKNISSRDMRAILTSNDHKTFKNSTNISPIKIDYFTWQLLASSDSSLLTSVYESLRYLDNVDYILKSCQFYIDVLLKDFPTEVFLQRTLLIQTFFELLKNGDSKVSLPVLDCLIATVKHLHDRFYLAMDISVIHSKEYCEGFTFNANKLELDGLNVCMNLEFFSAESDSEIEKEEEICDMKSNQYSVTQICFLILSEATTLLSKRKSAEEYNLTFELILETIYILGKDINSVIWTSKYQFKNNLYKTFSSFHDSIKYHKNNDQITYNIIIHIIIKALIILELPKEELNEVLPYCIQTELLECVSDHIFILLYPNLHSRILAFVEQFVGHRKNDVFSNYRDSLEIWNSMKSAIKFLKHCSNLKTKFEKLNHAQKALPSLEFHRNFQFIHEFVKICLFKWSEKELNEDEVELRKNVLLKLLSYNDEEVKVNTYRELHGYVIEYLGIEISKKPKFQHPGNKFGFLCNSEILTEMICYGLNSSHPEIQNLSREIFIHLLKGKVFFSEAYWQRLMKALNPCFPLLQCYADKSTPLGRCILKILDPDISRTILLPPLELLRGNLRLLFSKNHLIREEALLRLFWLLAKEDPEKKKLPRLNLLRGINLSSLCSSVSPEEYCNVKQSFYSVDSLCNVMEMLTAENIEPSVRRSALSQLSVMLEDLRLQQVFLEQNGLSAILDIFKNCLVEKEFQNYPDSALPIMNILKLICLENPSVRLHLSLDIEVYFCILRGLLLFNSERHSRQQGVELLCVLLYNECIINMHYERAKICKISLPEILANKICLPFLTYAHSKCSKHTEPSNREILMMREKTASLLRICWTAEWIGSISKLLSLENKDVEKNISERFLPNDMIVKIKDLELMRGCSLTFGIKSTLFDIQNATTHEDVMTSLNKLNRYLALYKLGRKMEGTKEYLHEFDETVTSLATLQWENTFERFFTSTPTCEDDELLLLHVVRILRFLLKTTKSEDLIVWIEKLLTDRDGTLPNIFNCYEKLSPSFIRKDLIRAVIGLIKEIIAENNEFRNDKWLFYISIISGQLQMRGKHEFYNIAYAEGLINVLVDITGTLSKKIVISKELYNEIIIGLMEIIVTLHCSKDSQNSFLGTNIIKNCLHILNHILADMQLTTKDWEHSWYCALSRVTGHNERPNYCWLLSLLFVRDPILRALALQFLVGFSLTCHSCELLIEGLYIEFEYIWDECFKILLDDSECNLVREKAALLLSNLACHGSTATASEFLQNLTKISFYEKLRNFLDKLHISPVLKEESDFHTLVHYYGQCEVSGDCMTTVLPMSSTSLISAINLLLLNIIFLNPDDVGEIILECNLINSLVKIFDEAPEACRSYMNEKHVSDLIQMYSVCCKIILKCMVVKIGGYSYVQQSQQFVNALYCLLNYSLFDENSKTVVEQRNQLWCEILDILSIILTGPHEEGSEVEAFQVVGFKAVNNAMTENGTDYFISSLYLAISSYSCDLRFRCLRFLANLFGIEAKRLCSLSVADIFDRNIFLESVQQAGTFCWKGFSISKELDSNFVIRVCDILLQAVSLNNHIEDSQFKILVSEALGNLLAVCKNAKNFCMDCGLADNILESLRTLFIKLNLENIDCLKKVSERKRIDPMLRDIEMYYRLLGNLITGDENIKSYVAGVGLSSLLHKLWPWCLASNSLHITTLKLLTIFTFKSEPASRALVSDKSWNMVGVRKIQGPATLLNTVMQHIENGIELTFKSQNCEVIRLSFQLLENCCISTECRSQIAKGSLFSCFINYFSGFPNKRRPQSDNITGVWYNFFVIFTSYQEGQLVLTKNMISIYGYICNCVNQFKSLSGDRVLVTIPEEDLWHKELNICNKISDNQEVLKIVIVTASTNSSYRKKALKILRNISFHSLNRVQLLSDYQFLSVLLETLKSGQTEEINLILHTIWGLISNSLKAKITIRNLGFEDLLKEVKKKLILSCDSYEVAIVDRLLLILQNK